MLDFRGAVNQIFLRLNKRLIESAVHSCVVYPRASSLTKPSLHEITVEEFSADNIRSRLNVNEDQSVILMSIYARLADYTSFKSTRQELTFYGLIYWVASKMNELPLLR
jgi:hypothetical protein